MWTQLYWFDGPWPGKLALAARPRGGDWLDDELESWKRAGVGVVVSLLTPEEEIDLDLREEARSSSKHGIKFLSFPIPDRQVPGSESEMAAAIEKLSGALSAGDNVVVHCRQGIGRSGLIAACLLVSSGARADAAFGQLTETRGVPIPETDEQRRWVDSFAAELAGAK